MLQTLLVDLANFATSRYVYQRNTFHPVFLRLHETSRLEDHVTSISSHFEILISNLEAPAIFSLTRSSTIGFRLQFCSVPVASPLHHCSLNTLSYLSLRSIVDQPGSFGYEWLQPSIFTLTKPLPPPLKLLQQPHAENLLPGSISISTLFRFTGYAKPPPTRNHSTVLRPTFGYCFGSKAQQ